MIYLMGGVNGFNNKIGEDFKLTLKDKKSIVFIPTTPENKEKCEKYRRINLEWFKEVGITFTDIDIINLEDTLDMVKNKIDGKEIIFLMGGDPISQLKLIHDKQLENDLIGSKAVIIGVSAGALSICEKCIITKDVDYSRNMVLDGLNLTKGLNVDVHYNCEHDSDINEIINNYNIEKIYGIPENCAIKIENDAIKFIGDESFCAFKNGNKTKIITH